MSSDSQGPNANINRLYETAHTGDQSAEHRLFEYLCARFQVFVRLRITNRQEAEDIVQEALAAIAGEYRDISFTSSFAAWAYKVLDNRILAYLQTKKRRGDRLEPDPYGTLAADSAADNPDPELKRRLLDCLRKLLSANPRYARALSQHYQGYSTEEICARIGIKANTFYSLLSRARSMLDGCLGKRRDFLMNGCSDKQFQDMLHTYELGMLSDDDRQEIEQHLMECHACFEYIKQREASAGLLRNDPDIRSTVLDAAKAGAPAKTTIERPWYRRVAPAMLAAAAILILLIVQPWRIEIHSTDEAQAVENRLAVMLFENLADPADSDRLGEIAANLLITDLSDSRYVQVVSGPRLHDILRQLGEQDETVPDRDLAAKVAKKAGAKWMLLGSILEIEPRLVATTQLIDVESGTTVTAEKIAGDPGEDIFSLIDRLTISVKTALALPAEARTETDRTVASVTTHSPEAYRAYLDGKAAYHKYYFDDARAAFEQVIALDSSFAMAYYYLARLSDRTRIDKAMEYLERASDKEQYFIRSLKAGSEGNVGQAIKLLEQAIDRYPDEKEAYNQLANYHYQRQRFDRSVENAEKATALDPFYKPAVNILAYAWDRAGDFEKAIDAIDRYIALAPQEPNPYDSRGDIYARNGKPGLAASSYRMAIDRKVDYFESWEKLGRMSLVMGDMEAADSCFRVLMNSNVARFESMSRFYSLFVPILSGKLQTSLALTDSSIAWAHRTGAQEFPSYHFQKALIHAERGDYEQALVNARKAYEVSEQNDQSQVWYAHSFSIIYLAQSGNITEAGKIASELKERIEKDGDDLRYYWLARGGIERARGNMDSAIFDFDRAVAEIDLYPAAFLRAQTLLDASRYDEAVAAFEELTEMNNMWLDTWAMWGIKTHYFLGQAYEATGRSDDAASQYTIFLERWGDSDPDIESVIDARQRLARLENES